MSRSVVTGKVIEINVENNTGIIMSERVDIHKNNSVEVKTYTPFSAPEQFIPYLIETMIDKEEVILELHPTTGKLYSILESDYD